MNSIHRVGQTAQKNECAQTYERMYVACLPKRIASSKIQDLLSTLVFFRRRLVKNLCRLACLKSRNPVGRSANGAKYDSQGQARSASPLVIGNQLKRALEVRNIFAIIALFQSFTVVYAWTRGDAPRSARRLPLAIIFRAFGAPQTDF